MSEPLYRPNQVLRNLHSWASENPARPVLDVLWDEPWGCYTYSFPFSAIRIEEEMLEPTGDPDITAREWAERWLEKRKEEA